MKRMLSVLSFLGLAHGDALSLPGICLWAALGLFAYTRATSWHGLLFLLLALAAVALEKALATRALQHSAAVLEAKALAEDAIAHAKAVEAQLLAQGEKVEGLNGLVVALRNRGPLAPGSASR